MPPFEEEHLKNLNKEQLIDLLSIGIVILLENGRKQKQIVVDLNQLAKANADHRFKLSESSLSKYKNRIQKPSHFTAIRLVTYLGHYLVNAGLFKKSRFKEVLKRFNSEPEPHRSAFVRKDHPSPFNTHQRWWVYFYDYEFGQHNDPGVMALPLEIDLSNEQYRVTLRNNPGYTTYRGQIVSSEDAVIILELEGGSKQQYLFLSALQNWSGKETMLSGVYLKHDRNGMIHSGIVILERALENEDFHPRILKFDKTIPTEGNRAIFQLFNKRSSSYLQPSRVFSPKDLVKWAKKQLKTSGELKKHDLFIAAPYISLMDRIIEYERAEKKLVDLLREFTLNNGEKLGASAAFPELEKEVQQVLERTFMKATLPRPREKEYQRLHKQILRLKSNLEEEVEGIDQIYYNRQFVKPELKKHLAPATVFKRDFDALRQSRAFLLVIPYPAHFSACWVQVGWAAMLQIPIFLIYHRLDRDIPFLLRERTSIAGSHYHAIEHMDDIPGLYRWFQVNEYDKKYFTQKLI